MNNLIGQKNNVHQSFINGLPERWNEEMFNKVNDPMKKESVKEEYFFEMKIKLEANRKEKLRHK